MESILTSTKKLLGIEEDDKHFDDELIMHINSALMSLMQIGVGPTFGLMIDGAENTWSEITGNRSDLSAIKTYVYLKTRLVFDPPQMGYLVDAITKQITELEWRLNVQVENATDEFDTFKNIVTYDNLKL